MEEKKIIDEAPANNIEVLLDGDMVAGIKVKPWTITQAAALSPVFERISSDMKKRKISFRDFFADGKVMNMDQLFFIIMPYAPEILKITLKATDEELDKIAQKDMMEFLAVIARQNIEYLKNLFALIVQMTRLVKGPTS